MNRISQLYERENGGICGLNVSMMGKWERDERLPSPMYRKLFCLLYKRSATELGFLSSPQEQIEEKQIAQGLAGTSRETNEIEAQPETKERGELKPTKVSSATLSVYAYATIGTRQREEAAISALPKQRAEDVETANQVLLPADDKDVPFSSNEEAAERVTLPVSSFMLRQQLIQRLVAEAHGRAMYCD